MAGEPVGSLSGMSDLQTRIEELWANRESLDPDDADANAAIHEAIELLELYRRDGLTRSLGRSSVEACQSLAAQMVGRRIPLLPGGHARRLDPKLGGELVDGQTQPLPQSSYLTGFHRPAFITGWRS